ncbi:exosome complex component RRP42 [Carpediemonas membranifera]|uniref:Ribosomal RNA-processing protein 42 n=1 Tax=Carpediemonas membranifera TaxID=201153 RepID=A0A8J6E407_9EUKA|nr:exosome complex component RRP42 [Carpediemonas membranifera]|eukprot:KAG9396266.1 exosome complex component RRP42 [Carpediemonas membranifera]
MAVLLSQGEKNFLAQMIASNIRIDGRTRTDIRPVCLEVLHANDEAPEILADVSCRASIGKTRLLVGISLAIETPAPHAPDQAILRISWMNSAANEPTPEQTETYELYTDILHASLIAKGGLDLSSELLAPFPGEKVWAVSVDILVFDDADGGVLDLSSLAACAALADLTIPAVREKDGAVIIDEEDRKPLDGAPPLVTTVGMFQQEFAADMTGKEEATARTVVHIASRGGRVGLVRTRGLGAILPAQLTTAVELAMGVEQRRSVA